MVWFVFLPNKKMPTIRTRLLQLVAVCVIPLVLGIAFIVSFFYERERDQIQHDGLNAARALVNTVDRDLYTSLLVNRALATSPYLTTGSFEKFHAQAQAMLGDEYPGLNFVLVDREARQLVNTVRPFAAPVKIGSTFSQVSPVFATSKPFISDLFVGDITKKPLVAISVPVIRDGSTIYSLSTGLDLSRFAEILTNQKLGPDRIATIVDSEGVVVARTHSAEKYIGKPLPKLLQEQIRIDSEGAIEGISLDGQTVYAGFSHSAKSNWTVLVGVPRSIVLGEILRSLRGIVLALLVLTVAVIFGAWKLARKVGLAVKSVADAAARVGTETPSQQPSTYFAEADHALNRLSTIELELRKHRLDTEVLIASRTQATHPRMQITNKVKSCLPRSEPVVGRARSNNYANYGLVSDMKTKNK
nr:cache domain-containing protein [Rhodoferax sp.]